MVFLRGFEGEVLLRMLGYGFVMQLRGGRGEYIEEVGFEPVWGCNIWELKWII